MTFCRSLLSCLTLATGPRLSQAQDTALHRLLAPAELQLIALEAVHFFKSSQAALDWSPAFQRASSSEVVAFGRLLARRERRGDESTTVERVRVLTQNAGFTIPGTAWTCANVVDVSVARASCALRAVPFYVEALDPRGRGDTAHVVVAVFRRDSTAPGFRSLRHSVRVARRQGEWRAISSFKIRG